MVETTTSTQRSTGTVKWFSAQKGFGFVARDDGGDDLFQTSILSQGFRTLSDNQLVEFSVEFGEYGCTKAIDVTHVFRSRRPSRGGRSGGRGRGRGPPAGGGYRREVYGGGGGGGRGGGSGACYNCGEMGHLARDCYQGGRRTTYSEDRGDEYGNRRYSGGGRGGVGGEGRGSGGGQCFNCGEEGPFARDCPNK